MESRHGKSLPEVASHATSLIERATIIRLNDVAISWHATVPAPLCPAGFPPSLRFIAVRFKALVSTTCPSSLQPETGRKRAARTSNSRGLSTLALGLCLTSFALSLDPNVDQRKPTPQLPARIALFAPSLKPSRDSVVIDRRGDWFRIRRAEPSSGGRNWELEPTEFSKQPLRPVSLLSVPELQAWLVTESSGSVHWMTETGLVHDILPSPSVIVDHWISSGRPSQVLGLSRWGRCLVRGQWSPSNAMLPEQLQWDYLDLPLAPTSCAVSDNHLWITSAYDSKLIAIDLESLSIVEQSTHHLGSITDLKWDSTRHSLWACSTRVNEQAATDASHLQEHGVVIHELTQIELGSSPTALPQTTDQRTIRLGQGSADPSHLLVDQDSVHVVMGGGGGVETYEGDSMERVAAWNCESPLTDAWISDSGLCVACRSNGMLFELDRQLIPQAAIELAQPNPDYRERGETLFFSARASLAGDVSCHSCHQDGHTNSQLADTLGDGSYGTPKLVPSLLGTADTDPWGWLGNRKEIGDQVARSFRETQHYPLTGEQTREVIGFLFQLKPPPASRAATERAAAQSTLAQGEQAFANHCAACHVAPLTFTTNGTFNVGLRDEQGVERFNPPSLRGVGQRSRFFHDGHARSLEAAVLESDHPPGLSLDIETLRAIIVYVESR